MGISNAWCACALRLLSAAQNAGPDEWVKRQIDAMRIGSNGDARAHSRKQGSAASTMLSVMRSAV